MGRNRGRRQRERWVPSIGTWDGMRFAVNGTADAEVTARLVNLMAVIDTFPGRGELNVATADGRQAKYSLPATDPKVRSVLYARLGNAMIIVGGVCVRLHAPMGQDKLYSIAFGNRDWRGCSADEVRDSYGLCSCCGEASGAILEQEVCCDWPTTTVPHIVKRA
jgi:hypothetical protein